MCDSTVVPSMMFEACASSTVAGLTAKICEASSFTKFWKPSFFATKSVSEFTSRITASFPSTEM